jgi:hypothetical protein
MTLLIVLLDIHLLAEVSESDQRILIEAIAASPFPSLSQEVSEKGQNVSEF